MRSQEAERDLLEICAFLGKTLAGERFLESLLTAQENLKLFSGVGTNGHPLDPHRRVVTLGEYLMSYESTDDASTGDTHVTIRRIFHGARRPGSL